MSDALETVIPQFVALLRRRFPAAAKQLRKPLSADDIRHLAVDHHIDFPESLYALFRSANGQKSSRRLLLPSIDPRVPGYALVPADLVFSWHTSELGSEMLYRPGMFGECRTIVADEDALREHWNERWFQFAEWEDERNGRYGRLFVDLAVASGTGGGRVIAQSKTVDMTRVRVQDFRETVVRRVVAPSLAEYFLRLVAGIEAGMISYDDLGSLVPARADAPPPAAETGIARASRRTKATVMLSIGTAELGFRHDRERGETLAEAAPGVLAEFLGGFGASVGRAAPVDVVLMPTDAESPQSLAASSTYQGALDWFVRHQAAVRDAVLARLLDYIAYLQNDVGIADATLAEVADAADLGSLLVPAAIRLFPMAKEGVPYLGIEFDCDWDVEHGCGVLLHGARGVHAGMAEEASAWNVIEADGGSVG